MNELKRVNSVDYINELRAEIERLSADNSRMRLTLKELSELSSTNNDLMLYLVSHCISRLSPE